MSIPLKRTDGQPLYLQIKEYLRGQIENGAFPPGTRLTPTRRLAAELGVNRITVVNAYAELEAEGLITSYVGRGTFVARFSSNHRYSAAPDHAWQTAFLRPPGVSAHSMLRDMLHLAKHPDIISFAMGAPAKDLLPAHDFRQALNTVLRRDGEAALQYDVPEGQASLRDLIARRLQEQGIYAEAGNILITSGSQQVIDLVARVLLSPGDPVIVENPTYLGAIEIFEAHRAQLIGVPLDEQGLRVDLLENLLARHQPKLIYTVRTFQNPTGITMNQERRERLLDLARRYGAFILEDGVCNELRYEGKPLPPLKGLDRKVG